jgi:hypothetical protein
VSITVACNDGTSAALAVPVGATSPAHLTPSLSFVFPTRCAVQEVDNGGGGASVGTTVKVLVNGAVSSRVPDPLAVGSNTASERVAVQFTNVYAAVSPPTTPPPSGPTTTGVLPATGGSPAWTVTSWALALVGLGGVMLFVRGRGRKATS